MRNMLAAKFFNSSNDEDQEALWLQNPWHIDAAAFSRERWTRVTFFSGHNISATTIATTFASSEMALKIILIYV